MSHDIIGLHEQAWRNPLKSNAFQIGTFGTQVTERPSRAVLLAVQADAPSAIGGFEAFQLAALKALADRFGGQTEPGGCCGQVFAVLLCPAACPAVTVP
jgi:hypothetical protein